MIVYEGVETSRPFRLGSGWPGPAPSPDLCMSGCLLYARSSAPEWREQAFVVSGGEGQTGPAGASPVEGARVRVEAGPPGQIPARWTPSCLRRELEDLGHGKLRVIVAAPPSTKKRFRPFAIVKVRICRWMRREACGVPCAASAGEPFALGEELAGAGLVIGAAA
jgi:hypothetical protein